MDAKIPIGPLHIAVAVAAYDVFVASVGHEAAAELIRRRIGDVESARSRTVDRFTFGDAPDVDRAAADLTAAV